MILSETSQNKNTSEERDLSSPMENPSQFENHSPIMTRSCSSAVVNPPDQLT